MSVSTAVLLLLFLEEGGGGDQLCVWEKSAYCSKKVYRDRKALLSQTRKAIDSGLDLAAYLVRIYVYVVLSTHRKCSEWFVVDTTNHDVVSAEPPFCSEQCPHCSGNSD